MSLLSDAKASVAKFLINMTRFDTIMNGDKNTDVPVDVGTVPTLRKLFDFIVNNVVGVKILGTKNTVADLPATGNAIGDIWIILTAGSGAAVNDGYVWLGTQWRNIGQIRGPQGIQGIQGPVGTISGNGGIITRLLNLVTTQSTVQGSVDEGIWSAKTKRTGGFGQYGNALLNYIISAATPAGQFDCGITSWVTHQNLTGGQVFGGWRGANSPSQGKDYSGNPLVQTWTGGGVIGDEINAGNRWAELGFQLDRGSRFTAGLQIVPDVLPAEDGPATGAGIGIFNGTFGNLIGASVHGHRWWTAEYIPYDTVNGGGLLYNVCGGSAIAGAPDAMMKLRGYVKYGFDFVGTIFTGAMLRFNYGTDQVADTATAGVKGALPATVQGYLIIEDQAGAKYRVPFYKA